MLYARSAYRFVVELHKKAFLIDGIPSFDGISSVLHNMVRSQPWPWFVNRFQPTVRISLRVSSG